MVTLNLPYQPDDLRPCLSTEGFLSHYEHYLVYESTLNTLTNENIFSKSDLTTLLRITKGTLQFNAIQVWNHAFYFSGMKPGGSYLGPGDLRLALNGCFGSMQSFRDLFVRYGSRGEASGWIWLVVNAEGAIEITRDHGSRHPLLKNFWPIFNCDLWDHAFEKDYGDDRESYINAMLKLADWEIIENRYLYALKQLSLKLLNNVHGKHALTF